MKEKVIVLGGNVPHIDLIKYLQEDGFYVVLIDFAKDAPASPFADEHIVESTLDLEKVLNVAKQIAPKYILDACIDRPIPVAAYVAEQLGLPHPISYETSLIATNKNLMKQMMLESGIPTSKYKKVMTINDIEELSLKYPMIVKPASESGSIGIKRVDSVDDLRDAVDVAIKLSRGQGAIVEEFVDGKEIQIDCFIHEGKHCILDVKEKRKFRTDILTTAYGSYIPASISETIKTKIDDICEKIVINLGLTNTPMFLQALVDENNIAVIEYGIRIGGLLSYKIVRDITGFDIMKATMKAYTGRIPEMKIKNLCNVYTTNHVFSEKGTFDHIIGVEQLMQEGTISDYKAYMKRGDVSHGNLDTRDRVGSFIIKANDYNDYKTKMRRALEVFDVINVKGESIMKKNIYTADL